MNEFEQDMKSIINNEYDYSNILPTIEYVSYLVKYCDSIYKNFVNLIEQDEEKNKQFKPEYREYRYKKVYRDILEVYIREKTYNNITCKDFDTFQTAISAGNLNNVLGIKIELRLDFRRGKGESLDEHENLFTIIFEPYNIKFARKSNYKDMNMTQIENTINEVLMKFPIANCIFCNK